MTSRGRDLERERDFLCGSTLGTWRYWVLGIVYGDDGEVGRGVVVRAADIGYGKGMWYGQGTGQRVRAGQGSQVMSGHGGHCAGYRMCELRYGITARSSCLSTAGRSVRWLRLAGGGRRSTGVCVLTT